MTPRAFLLSSAAFWVAAGAAGKASDPALQPAQVVLEGDLVTGVGLVTTIDNVAVDANGLVFVESDTDNPNTAADGVITANGALLFQHGQALTLPAGATISSFDALAVNSHGDIGWNVDLAGLTTTTDSGIFRNDKLVIQEGAISTAGGFSPGTRYVGFLETKFNDNGQFLIAANVDDFSIPTAVDRAIVIAQVDAAGNLIFEIAYAKEGDILPGQTAPVADFGTGPHSFDFSNFGDVMLFVDTTDAGAVDGNIYLNASLIAREGSPSPVAGRTWRILLGARMALSGNGDHHVYQGQLSAPTTDDLLIVLDGDKFMQEGDTLPAIAPFTFTAFGTGALAVTDEADVVWVGDWNDPDTTKDVGLFLNDQLLVQEGVTQINGLTVESIALVQDNFEVSPNGRYIVFEATLTGGLNGAFVFDRGPWQKLGGGKAGTHGVPRLVGTGTLEAGTPISITIDKAAPTTLLALIVGLSQVNLPYLGATLVPSPDVVIPGLPTDGDGFLRITTNFPAGVPAGVQIYMQALVIDAGAFANIAATNAVVATTP
jgi:hypothetical protein